MNFFKIFSGGRFIFAAAILAALVMLMVSEGTYWHSKQSMDKLVQMRASRVAISQITENLVNAESGLRAFALTGEQEALKPAEAQRANIAKAFEQLAQQHSHQPPYLAAMVRLRSKIERRLLESEEGVLLRQAGRLEEAVALAVLQVGKMEATQGMDDELVAIDTAEREEARAAVYRALLLARYGVMLISAVGLLALLIYLRQTRQIQRHLKEVIEIEKTHLAKLETEVALRTAKLTDLTRHMVHAREDERNRLARNLHDDLGALLTSAKLNAARIKPRLAAGAPQALELLSHLVANLNACVALGRNIIENLRPSALTNLGLVATLEIVAREFCENSGIKVQCQLEPVALDANAELTAYRIVQEALTNISKYARASQVWITLGSHNGQAVISVRDDGVGFDPQAKQSAVYGLLGMRFRVESAGGTLNVVSAPKAGTTVIATMKQRSAPAAKAS